MSNSYSFDVVKSGVKPGAQCDAENVVRAPRADDDIAHALSTAFDCADGLPHDWQSILAQLDRAATQQPHR